MDSEAEGGNFQNSGSEVEVKAEPEAEAEADAESEAEAEPNYVEGDPRPPSSPSPPPGSSPQALRHPPQAPAPLFEAALHYIIGSQNVYSRAEGIADHYWPWAVF